MSLYNKIRNAYLENKKLLFVLIDPDNFNEKKIKTLIESSGKNGIDAFLVGGSLITNGNISTVTKKIKNLTSAPICLFPGNYSQIDNSADSILFMSLISGRNPEFLIGNQVIAAPILKKSKLEIIPTAYMLIDGGKITSVNYMSNTLPIPADKDDIASSTALAGEMLGMRCVYMDAGSGASKPISTKMIKSVSQNINIPLIIGGGIKSYETAHSAFKAGATVIVVGSVAEENPEIIKQIQKGKTV